MCFLQFSVSVLNAIKKQDKNTGKKRKKRKKVAAILFAYSGQITLSSERGEFGSEVTGKQVYLTSPPLRTFAKPCAVLCPPAAFEAQVLHTHSPHPPTRDILTELQQLSSAWGHRGKQDCAAWQARVSPTWMQKIRLGRFCCQLSNFIFWFPNSLMWILLKSLCHHNVPSQGHDCTSFLSVYTMSVPAWSPWLLHSQQHAREAAGGCSWEYSSSSGCPALNLGLGDSCLWSQGLCLPTH